MTEPIPTPAEPRNWSKIVLVGSLALNLLIIGAVAGSFLGGPPDRDRNPVLRELGFAPFIHAMSRPDQKALLDQVKGKVGSFRDNRAAIKADFQAVLQVLRAETFDPAALEAAVSRQRSRIGKRQADVQELLLRQIAEMTAQDRAAYAERLEEALRRGPPKRRK